MSKALGLLSGGLDSSLAALCLKRQGVDVTAIIAGEDEQGGTGFRKTLETLIDELKMNDHVKLLGAVSEDVVRGELESAHAFVLPSYHEPLGVAIMEAMAMRTPVVTTRQGGVTELVDEGVDGLLVNAKDVEPLADVVAGLLRDPALALRLSEASRRKIETKFHSGVSAAAIVELSGR